MASRSLSETPRRARAAALWRPRSARPAIVVAAALPVLFLHADFQPGVDVAVAGTTVALRLSDLAVASVLAAAVAVGARRGAAVLGAGLPLWGALGLLLAWVGAATLYGPAVLDGYPLAENAVTAAKFAEYVLLAPAVALLVRSHDDVRAIAAAAVGWTAVASLVGLAQILGADVFDAWPAGWRQPSFLGHHDFAGLSAAVYAAGVASLVLAPPLLGRRTSGVAVAAGGVGLVLAAPLAGVLGMLLAVAAVAAAALSRPPVPLRRLAASAAVTAVVVLGVLGMRSGEIGAFLDFVRTDEPTSEIETYSHRTLLAYIGWQIFLDHPALGVGWQGSSQPAAFRPHLDDARERFPDAAPGAFPAPGREWGVQSAYVQALADLGAIGLALLVGIGAAALALVRRTGTWPSPAEGPATAVGLLWLLAAAGLWAAQGLVAGLPLSALTALALGLVAAGAARRERHARA